MTPVTPEIRGQILRFLLVGGTTVLIDLLVYRLIMFAGAVPAAAKAAGFLTGAVFAYFANRSWTFGVTGEGGVPREMLQFMLIYGGSLVANVAVNSALLMLLGRSEFALAFAFVVATAVSATLNFLGMKFLVFRGAARETT